MTAGFFIAGTDTGVGKTTFAAALLRSFRARGLRVAAMKPVAAGTVDGRNEDVEALVAASSPGLRRELACPYLFDPPIAPHIAAAQAGVRIDLTSIEKAYSVLVSRFDVVVVEGVGGFRVPLNEREDTADLAQRLELPLILVVGMRLGCLNHALLTGEAIAQRAITLAGWVANRIDPRMARCEENIRALEERLDAPLLADVPYGPPSELPVRLERLQPARGSR